MDNVRAVQILRDAGTYMPAVVPYMGGYRIYSGLTLVGSGTTIDAAMDAWRESLPKGHAPPLPMYFADGQAVMRKEGLVATAISKTVATRIANALNAYMPNRRGR